MPDKEQTYGDDKSSMQERSPQPAIRNSKLQMKRRADPVTLIRQARREPRSLTRGDFVQLQHAIGNRAVAQLLEGVAGRQDGQISPAHTGLPEGLRSGVESLSGMSMEGVNVHYNSSRPAQLDALAYTQGRDIHLGPGQERHLPHEAWHVVQQAQGRVQATTQMEKGIPVNDDEELEHEADVMGAEAAQRKGATEDHRVLQGRWAQVQRMVNRAIQLVKYPAYQTFDGNNGNTYCSSVKFKSHAEGSAWIKAVLKTLPGVSVDGKPRAVNAQPQGAIII